ncbi:MAG: immunoglobulin domain-containing protein, partial [Verrucomicrobiales bacterium]|nr:immunoglobulin domain-containing protein [Verrucomicrobiales bacterium]
MPASINTPSGAGTTGNEWWPANWHYFVMPESVKEALRSDGTPFQVVGDTNIIAGDLLDAGGLPKYPIVISLASEAINDAEIAQFTNYVAAGGFLFVGSSAFTRNTNGTTRTDFAFANAMGVHMVNPGLTNWFADELLTKTLDHRIVNHIPNGQLWWLMPLSAEDISWGLSPSHPINHFHLAWQVQSIDATVIAIAGDTTTNYPYLLVKPFGNGYFIYHAAMQPLIGHGGNDSGMYAYGIFRKTIEWAFQSAKTTVPKLSPWPYKYDAAVMFRHDFEAFTNFINTTEASAQFENSVSNSFGERAKGDYYFCTGTLRTRYGPIDITNEIASLKRAITNYGATIGSHNGGLTNAQNLSLGIDDYDYWHWGPDEALDITNPPPSGYANGKAYAQTSISNSFTDIEGWGLTNNSGLRQWVSPAFNSTREASKQILAQLGVATAGEEKLGPFPHWTLSTQTSGLRYSFLSLPVSDWYVGSLVGQAVEEHTLASVDALVDYYYDLGALINLYGHSSSAGGPGILGGGVLTTPQLQQEYVVHSMAKPRVWSANADILYAWWLKRSTAQITPTATPNGNQLLTTLVIAGASDTNTAVEVFIPSTNYTGLQVFTNGVQTGLTSYRIVGQTIRILVGTSVTNAQVSYTIVPVAQNDAYFVQPSNTLTVAAPGVLANDTSGWGTNLTAVLVTGPTNGSLTLNSNGGFTYTPTNNPTPVTDTFIYKTDDGQTNSAAATVTIAIISPPVITSQPVSLTNAAGTSTSFTVGATSSVPVTYAWFKNATNQLSDGGNVSGSATATLAISSVTGANAGAYTVVVANPVGSVTSAPPATLTVTGSVDPNLAGPPVGYVQNGGSTVELSVVATGTSPFTYQWKYNGQAISGANTDWVVLTGVTNSGGTYSVVVSNSIGSVTGTVAVLQTMATGAIFSDGFVRGTDPGPISPWVAAVGGWTVTGQMLTTTALTANLANAYVDGTNWGDYSVEANVRFPVAGSAGAYGGGIGGHLNPVTGTHYAAWIYPEGSPGGSAVLKLVKFFDWSNWSGTPMQLSPTSLPNGVGTTWHTLNLTFHLNELIVYWDGIKVADVTDNNFSSLPPYWNGGITADVWASSAAQAMIVSNVVVSDFPVTIVSQPVGVVTNAGSTVNFNVTASGATPLTYQWLKNSVALTDGGNVTGSTTSNLTLANVSGTDAANYQIVVSNVFGAVTSSNATLTVNTATAPAITNPPASLSVVVNSNATFTVGASGDAPLVYQWFFNGTNAVGLNTNELALANVQGTNAGGYTVVITNSFGSVTSAVATLTVNFPPAITNPPASLSVVLNSNATFTVGASGDTPLVYQWFFQGTNAVGLNTNVLSLANVQGTNAGGYTVVIT